MYLLDVTSSHISYFVIISSLLNFIAREIMRNKKPQFIIGSLFCISNFCLFCCPALIHLSSLGLKNGIKCSYYITSNMQQRFVHLLVLGAMVMGQIECMQNTIYWIYAWRSVAEHHPEINNYGDIYWLPFLHIANILKALLPELERRLLVLVQFIKFIEDFIPLLLLQ